MLTTSAALALVLHCTPPHPRPPKSLSNTIDLSSSSNAPVRGDLSPCPVVSRAAAPVVIALESGKPRERLQPHDQLPQPNFDQIPPPLPSLGTSPAAAPAANPQPAYESWDVMRQYPHTAPLAAPSAASSKPNAQSSPPDTSEKKDAKTQPAIPK